MKHSSHALSAISHQSLLLPPKMDFFFCLTDVNNGQYLHSDEHIFLSVFHGKQFGLEWSVFVFEVHVWKAPFNAVQMKLTCLALIRGYINIRPHTKTTCRQTMAFILSHSALPPVRYGHFFGGGCFLSSIFYFFVYKRNAPFHHSHVSCA